jgi:dUTP pyrophosphatase
VGGGVIDEDYRGNIGVILFNHSKTPFYIYRGVRVAKLICERILYPTVREAQELENTERGTAGFGSTGRN